MARRRSRSSGFHLSRQGRWRLATAAVLLATAALVALPKGLSDRARLWAAPVFTPFQDVTEDMLLSIGRQMRTPGASEENLAEALRAERDRREALENALARAAAILDERDRRIRALVGIRSGLEGMPAALVPARIVSPAVVGGRAGAGLAAGREQGVQAGAAVVTRPLDRGSAHGVREGHPVLTAAGLVGVVEAVGPLRSTVRLVTDPETRLMVQVIARRDGRWLAGPVGLARGTPDGLGVEVAHVGREHDVREGDFVVTSPSAESPVPPYLVVGRIVACETTATEPLFYRIRVEPRAAPGQTTEVFVLTPPAAQKPEK